MGDKALYHKKVYQNKDATSILFFIYPFGIKLRTLHLSVKKLQRAGYTVIAYDTNDAVFRAADPNILINIVEGIAKDVALTVKAYEQEGIADFGFFGSSLGAFIAYNCVAQIPQLRWGVFNTGGNIAEAMWRFKGPREKHLKKGITLDKLSKVWHHLQYPKFGNLAGNRYIFLSSPADKIAPIEGMDEYIQLVKDAGANVSVVSVRALDHTTTAIVGLRRSVPLLQQVRDEVK